MLDKYLKFLPLALFSAYFIKAITLSVNYPEACILAVLGLVACYFQSQNNDKKLKELEDKIHDAHKILDLKIIESVQKFESRVNEVESIKAQLNAIKVNSLSRPLNNVR